MRCLTGLFGMEHDYHLTVKKDRNGSCHNMKIGVIEKAAGNL